MRIHSMCHRISMFALCLGLPALAGAQVELTPQVGYRSGGLDVTTGVVCVQAPCPSFASSEPDLLMGAVLDVPLRQGLQLELLFNRQPTTLSFSDSPGGRDNGIPSTDLDITHLHAGLLHAWNLSSWEPYVVLGAGQSRLESDAASGVTPGGFSTDRFSASLGGGAKIGLGRGDRFGLRLEARGYWVDAPRSLAGEGFLTLRDELTQFETTTGLTFKI